MIYIVKMNSNLVVTSEDKYAFPYGEGQVTYPINSLAYVIDESNIVTFRSAYNNDVLFTGHLGKIMIEGTIVDRSNFSELFDSIAFGSTGGGEGGGSGINEAMLKAKGYMRGVTLTQNEYDELSDKEGNVLYNVSDAPDPLSSFVEVVEELPTENISNKKIYFLHTPQADMEYKKQVNISASIDASLEPVYPITDRYGDSNFSSSYYNGAVSINTSSMAITTNNKWRIRWSGFSSFDFAVGLKDIKQSLFKNKVYIGVGHLNEDLSTRPEDQTSYDHYYSNAGSSSSVTWYDKITYDNLDPSKEYFVDVWSNGGVTPSLPLYGVIQVQPYFATPYSTGSTIVKNPDQFKEYAWINGEWELIGEDDKSNYYTKNETANTFLKLSDFHTWTPVIRANEAAIEALQKEWIGTQAEFDALAEKDENTTYYITEE